jgi:hypothetical protein
MTDSAVEQIFRRVPDLDRNTNGILAGACAGQIMEIRLRGESSSLS